MKKFTHIFDRTILREYDIRGVVNKTLHRQDAYAVGRSFGTLVARKGGKTIGICYDGRHSSPLFADEIINGIRDTGINVENYHIGPTPMAYFALYYRHLDAVLVVTGSHNPPEYNGIKMALKSGPFYGDDILTIGKMAQMGDVIESNQKGTLSVIDIRDAYTSRLAKDYNSDNKKPLKIVWDAGNGSTGSVLKMLVDKLSGTHHLLFEAVDGNFPNHHPDPSVEKNLIDLKQAVIKQQADFGVAFDGDGDRIGVVTRTGKTIWSDQLTALYARDILKRQPDALTILDVKCSQTACDQISQWGGKTLMWKVGHSLAKAKMIETGAALAGELSGHIFFKEGFYGHDDALYCAVRLMNIVHRFGCLDDQMEIFPKVHNTPEVRFEVPEDDKFSIIERAKSYLKEVTQNDFSVLDIDGVRVSNHDGWWLLRASNTQNVLTIRAESKTQEGLNGMIKSLKDTLYHAKCDFPDPLFR